MITASRMELAKRCPGAFALPHHDTPTPEAEAGTERHSERELLIGNGDIPFLLSERWPGFEWRAEVKFSIDLVTGAGYDRGQGRDRDYHPEGPFEIWGTADVVGRSDDRLVVLDWKSFDPSVSRAAVNAQLHIAALALSRAYRIDAVEVAIHHELRALDVAELDAFDLAVFEVEAKGILEGAARARSDARSGIALELHEGAWCRYCPALGACPKKLALAADVRSGAAEQRVEALIPFHDDESAADAYEFAERVRQLLRRLDAALYARAKERPIPLRSGKMLGLVEKLGNEKLDGDTVYAIVKEKYGQGIADAAVIRSATKKRLGEALAFAGVKAKAAAEREVLDAVRAAGGAKREKKVAIDEYDPGKQLESGE